MRYVRSCQLLSIFLRWMVLLSIAYDSVKCHSAFQSSWWVPVAGWSIGQIAPSYKLGSALDYIFVLYRYGSILVYSREAFLLLQHFVLFLAGCDFTSSCISLPTQSSSNCLLPSPWHTNPNQTRHGPTAQVSFCSVTKKVKKCVSMFCSSFCASLFDALSRS